MQLNTYHSDLYIAKISNRSYYRRKPGEKISKLEKCLCGGILTTILLLIIVGPFLLFSNLGLSAEENPVNQAVLQFNIVVEKSDEYDPDRTNRIVYETYKSGNPLIYAFSDQQLIDYNLTKYPETKIFDAD
jgi:hypothetical protein